MQFFGKKLMPAGDLVQRPAVHWESGLRTVVTGFIISAVALVLILVYAMREGIIIRSKISDNACSEGFTVKRNCEDVTNYPLIVQTQLHVYLQAEMVFARRPQSEEELHEAMGAMDCVVKQLPGALITYQDILHYVFEVPSGLPYICSSPNHPWMEITLIGLSASSNYKTFIRIFDLETERLPPPPDPAWKFQVAGGTVGKGRADMIGLLPGVPPDRVLSYAGLIFRMDNGILLWWIIYFDCAFGVTLVDTVIRDCTSGAPFYDSEEYMLDPGCFQNYSVDLGAYLNRTVYDIIGREDFIVNTDVGDFNGMLAKTCSNFTQSLAEYLLQWESSTYGPNAREIPVLIQDAIDTLLRACPFQVMCDTEERTLPNMLTVAFPFLSLLSKGLGAALPIVYGLWLNCMLRKSAAGLVEESAKESKDRLADELKLLVDVEVRKAMAQFKDELNLLVRTSGVQAPAPEKHLPALHEGEAPLQEAPSQLEATVITVTDAPPSYVPLCSEWRQEVASDAVANAGGDGDPRHWRKELDELRGRLAAAESTLAALREASSMKELDELRGRLAAAESMLAALREVFSIEAASPPPTPCTSRSRTASGDRRQSRKSRPSSPPRASRVQRS